MAGVIYLLKDGDQLVEMKEQAYDSEDLLQALLAQYPNLMAGDQIDSKAPRKWLLIKREKEVPGDESENGRWSVDHLFLDQDGVPTLVEVKRSSDTRIRREVVGQMLDYAANAVAYWSIDKIQAQFEANCTAQGSDPNEVLQMFLTEQTDQDQFWQNAKTNLQAGKIRMLFVADEIPAELRRVVEFLNSQMDPAEVLAIEIKQFVGQGLKTLVPRVIGQTAEAESKKSSRLTGESKQWDEASFFQTLEARRGMEETSVAREILDWSKDRGLRIWWGKGGQSGSFFPMVDYKGKPYWTVSVWTYGSIEIQFQMLQTTRLFNEESKRIELHEKFNAIPGIAIPITSITKRPSIRLSVLKDLSVLKQFLSVLDWLVDQIRGS
jgi:hypothetical protein